MVRYSDYSQTEIKMMTPYELDIYSAILMKQLKNESEHLKRRK